MDLNKAEVSDLNKQIAALSHTPCTKLIDHHIKDQLSVLESATDMNVILRTQGAIWLLKAMRGDLRKAHKALKS